MRQMKTGEAIGVGVGVHVRLDVASTATEAEMRRAAREATRVAIDAILADRERRR